MRRVHPLWRGFWLAMVLTAALVLLGGVDWLAPYHLDRRALILCGAAAAGAFLAALPGRLKRRRERPPRTTWQRCLRAFLCGAAMTLAAGMAGSGRILPALMEGSTGAYAFVGAAWAAGFLTMRIAGAVAAGREARA